MSCPAVAVAIGWTCRAAKAGSPVTSRKSTPVKRRCGSGRRFTMNMVITKQTVADKIAGYLHHEIALAQLVDWAENAIMEGDFSEQDADTLSAVISRLGVADVRAFGLTWEDCERLLRQLGYAARVDVVVAQP